jgi:hypothetical protein
MGWNVALVACLFIPTIEHLPLSPPVQPQHICNIAWNMSGSLVALMMVKSGTCVRTTSALTEFCEELSVETPPSFKHED